MNGWFCAQLLLGCEGIAEAVEPWSLARTIFLQNDVIFLVGKKAIIFLVLYKRYLPK